MTDTTILKTTLDSTTMLRLLGQAAVRIAEGETLTKDWLIRQFDSPDRTDAGQEPESHGPYLTVTEAYGRMRIGRSKFYDLLHKRLLKTIPIGARRMVPLSEVDRYMASQLASGDQV